LSSAFGFIHVKARLEREPWVSEKSNSRSGLIQGVVGEHGDPLKGMPRLWQQRYCRAGMGGVAGHGRCGVRRLVVVQGPGHRG